MCNWSVEFKRAHTGAVKFDWGKTKLFGNVRVLDLKSFINLQVEHEHTHTNKQTNKQTRLLVLARER